MVELNDERLEKQLEQLGNWYLLAPSELVRSFVTTMIDELYDSVPNLPLALKPGEFKDYSCARAASAARVNR
jgi:hypothetical protein